MTVVAHPASIADAADAPDAPDAADAGPLPTFVGIGAQRAGTTWLYECLRQHPEVFCPDEKELGFFMPGDDRPEAWYRARFAAGAGFTARGEITPTYITSPDAMRALAALVPDARLFVVLREPISRAYSAYQLFKDKRFNGVAFADACSPQSDLVRYGRYADQLRLVFDLYPRQRVKVVLYDDIVADPAAALRGVFEYLGVDPTFAPPALSQRYNRVIFPHAQRRLERIGMTWALDAVKTTPLGDWIKRLHARAGRRAADAIAPADRDRLAAHFADDIDRLERLIDRDLSAWRR